MYYKQKKIDDLQRQIRKSSSNLRVVVGSGGYFEPGWIPTDIDTLNLLQHSDWDRFFKPASINAILAEHVWEHLNLEEGKNAIRYCFKYLRPGGYLRIAVPDGFHPDVEYIEAVKVGGSGPGSDTHKILYNYKLLQNILIEAGFKVQWLEYFDEEGCFHYSEWDPNMGKIYRSKRFDERNLDGKLTYTSLIIDAIKDDAPTGINILRS